MSIISSETKTGEAKQVGNYHLTPLSQVFKIQFPGGHAGLVWNRPKAVVVRTTDGQEQVLPVTDVTRVTIWAMLAGGIAGIIAMGLLSRFR